MICSQCAESIEHSELCPHCQRDPRLQQRYILQKVLASGAQATTYLAQRIPDNLPVAIKELLVRRVQQSKALQLFEREARVLRQLEHPCIPDYVEHFEAGEGKQLGLYLVQRFVDGENLALERQHRSYDEREIFSLLSQLLRILNYLASLRPPVVHRDIKPGNIIRERDGGRLVLVDFGSVRAALDSELGGSTVAGTFGYMAPEQLMGRARPVSDIYALGATAVALLSDQNPDALYDDQRCIHVGDLVADLQLRRVLQAMLDRDPDRRPQDPAALAEHIEALLQGRPGALLRMGDRLLAQVPPAPRAMPVGFLQSHGVEARFKIIFGSAFGGAGGLITVLASLLAMRGAGLPWPLMLVALVGSMGIFGGVGGRQLRSGLRLRSRLRKLYANGQIVAGQVTRVGTTSYSTNGRRPRRVQYRYSVEGTRYIGQHDVDADSEVTKGDEVPVLIDPADPKSSMLWQGETST